MYICRRRCICFTSLAFKHFKQDVDTFFDLVCVKKKLCTVSERRPVCIEMRHSDTGPDGGPAAGSGWQGPAGQGRTPESDQVRPRSWGIDLALLTHFSF